ncbi:F-box/LRR-repeat protein At5g63520 [Manihot esculenta]|uniref:FIST C-domain domain-containing protein n=2 Tax=Manihot esculenta TaxID=3983 RepID=A0A2C9VRN1_MANES|nr:F-box/LRR-repeat protein At5g63520 [Manihot esculenta]KAG8652684.1 hypothetical protein MANES_06G120900v8 [Manihot esculenta]OAY47971.1 hypothetical protein MANES_06G120900v8 [Manihot esculenta]
MEMNPPTKEKMRASGFSLVSEDVVENILSRLPALSFASAACVSRCWNKVCGRILSKPKLASALSLNPSLHDAVKEVLEKVLSQPIYPHFAIACIGKQFSLELTHQLITEKLGSKVPVITNAASGIIGFDARNVLKEIKWESSDDEDDDDEDDLTDSPDKGIVLVVGFVPGLKVDAIPLLRTKTVPQKALVDKFLMDIRSFTASVSDCTSPAGIILFGNRNVDMKPVLASMDCAMNEETVIVGDASGCFLYRSADSSRDNHADMNLDAVALVFARDKHKSDDIGEIQFHVTLSTGVMPFGPHLQAVCVIAKDTECSWLTARLQGQYDILDAEGLLVDINDQFNEEESPDLYIGVVQHRECYIGAESSSRASLAFYEVIGGDKEFFIIKGVGVKPGDSFLFYHSDADTASSSCGNAYRSLANLKEESESKNCLQQTNVEEKEVFGGLIFSCVLRGESFDQNAESFPFRENFPGVPLAGVYCGGEIGRGSSSSISQEDDEANSARCCLHYHSTVYLVMSYVPANAED